MLVQDLFTGAGELRYALRDGLATRYSNNLLLQFLNTAIKAFARDTLYFQGAFEVRIVAGQARYKLDSRILRVFTAHTKYCTYNLLSPSKPFCTKRTGYRIKRIMPSHGNTKEIVVYPVFSEIPSNDDTFEGIVIDDDFVNGEIPHFGVTLQIDDDGNAIPVINVTEDYIPIALLCAYLPNDLSLTDEVPETVLEVFEALKLYIVHLATSQSGLTQTDRINKDAYSEYTGLARQFKKLVTTKFMKVPYSVEYRTPFSRPQPRSKDF
jgi:hypothetical protein